MRRGAWLGLTVCLAAVLLGQQVGAQAERVSGRIVAVDQGTRLATARVNPGPAAVGQRAQIIREVGGQWVEVAPGRVVLADADTVQVAFQAPAPGLAPPAAGDYVNVYAAATEPRVPPSGGAGLRVEAEPLLAPDDVPSRAPAPHGGQASGPLGDRLALSVGLGGGFLAAFKESSPSAPPGEAGMWGPSGGGALLVRSRLWRYLGVSTGLYFDKTMLSKRTTVQESYTAEPGTVATDYRPSVTATHLRIPLLIQAVAPLGPVRLTAGAGPELSLGLNADATVEATTPGYILGTAGTRELREMQETLEGQYSALAKNQVFFTVELGLEFLAGPVSIPVLLRAAYNPDEDPVFVDYWTPGAGGEQPADHTLDLRAYVGVCYDMDLL